MFAAMKASHHVVSITILGSLLIKLLTVVSTGLFMLQDVTLQSPHTNLIAQGKFDGSKFDSARVGGNAALTVAGLNLLNLSYPLGTTDQHAFQPFNMSKSIPGMYALPFRNRVWKCFKGEEGAHVILPNLLKDYTDKH